MYSIVFSEAPRVRYAVCGRNASGNRARKTIRELPRTPDSTQAARGYYLARTFI